MRSATQDIGITNIVVMPLSRSRADWRQGLRFVRGSASPTESFHSTSGTRSTAEKETLGDVGTNATQLNFWGFVRPATGVRQVRRSPAERAQLKAGSLVNSARNSSASDIALEDG